MYGTYTQLIEMGDQDAGNVYKDYLGPFPNERIYFCIKKRKRVIDVSKTLTQKLDQANFFKEFEDSFEKHRLFSIGVKYYLITDHAILLRCLPNLNNVVVRNSFNFFIENEMLTQNGQFKNRQSSKSNNFLSLFITILPLPRIKLLTTLMLERNIFSILFAQLVVVVGRR